MVVHECSLAMYLDLYASHRCSRSRTRLLLSKRVFVCQSAGAPRTGGCVIVNRAESSPDGAAGANRVGEDRPGRLLLLCGHAKALPCLRRAQPPKIDARDSRKSSAHNTAPAHTPSSKEQRKRASGHGNRAAEQHGSASTAERNAAAPKQKPPPRPRPTSHSSCRRRPAPRA